MKRFIEGEDRKQITLLPECLDDYIAEDNPIRAVEAFIDELDLGTLGFAGAVGLLTCNASLPYGRFGRKLRPQDACSGSPICRPKLPTGPIFPKFCSA